MDWLPIIWIITGIACILLEFVIPGLIIIFFGVGALVTGLALLAGLPTGNGIPFILFSAVSIASIILLRKQFAKIFRGTDVVNDDGRVSSDDDIVGCSARVIAWDDTRQEGKIDLRGSTWNARSTDTLTVGDAVKVSKRNGIHLLVEKS